jgi:hypothetical protein
MVVEALLTIILLVNRVDTYRHKEIRSTGRPTYSVPFSWPCLAELYEDMNVRVCEHGNSG